MSPSAIKRDAAQPTATSKPLVFKGRWDDEDDWPGIQTPLAGGSECTAIPRAHRRGTSRNELLVAVRGMLDARRAGRYGGNRGNCAS